MRLLTIYLLCAGLAWGCDAKTEKQDAKKDKPSKGSKGGGDEGDQSAIGLEDALLEVLEPTIDTSGSPGKAVGMAIAVVTPEGKATYGFGATEAGGSEKPDGKTVYMLASVTKVFTSLVLAKAALEDELELDDPIDDFLPQGVEAPSKNGKKITFESLASHLSGLPDLPTNYPQRSANPEPYTKEMLYDFLNDYELRRAPGDKYEYSNIGMALMAHVVTDLAQGRSFEQGIIDDVASPLGMDDTMTTVDDDREARMPKGYDQGIEQPKEAREIMVGSGSLTSTAEDMALFIEANINGADGVLGKAMIESRKPRGEISEGAEIGLGIEIRKIGGHVLYVKPGTHNGFSSFIAYDLERKIGFALLTNCFEYKFKNVVGQLMAVLAGEEPSEVTVPGTSENQGDGGEEGEGGQIPDADQIMARRDTDGDGKLKGDEIPEQMRDKMDKIDQNEDGAIDLEELERVVQMLWGGGQGGQGGQASGPRAKFDELDVNGDGKLQVDEVPPMIRPNFGKGDKNGDGGIDFEEFKQVVQGQT